jgi:large subunit ribosomal protein L15
LPKKGFRSPFAKDYTEINVSALAGLEAGTVVTHESMRATRLVSRVGRDGVKVLGRGDLGVALHVRVAKLSKTAAEKIVAAGGTIEGPLPE